ncbi:membrane protein [Fulvitalea axinellae]|uniref:Membrane protein n=1 Tax=Fulvitalea axinellae TaxID=1182444 RepID=A0AAU9D9G6_9BACT|nr:membrane protein [Fulvitalea axinellae]
MRRWLYILIFLLSAHTAVLAQGIDIFSQYADNLYLANPAAIGLSDGIEINMAGRTQWVGIDYSPQSYILEINSKLNGFEPKTFPMGSMRTGTPHPALRIPKKPGQKSRPALAMEGYLRYDESGAFRTTTVNIGAAVHFPFSKGRRLAVGLKSGFGVMQLIDGRANRLINPDDPTYNRFLDDFDTRYEWDLSGGVFFYTPTYFVGYAVNKSSRRRFATESNSIKHIFLDQMIVGGYNFDVGPHVTLRPAVYLQIINPQPVDVDANLTGFYDKKFWLGIGYRSSKELYALAGAKILDRISIGYSFSMIQNGLEDQSHGTHEVVLKITTKKKKK